MKLAAFALALAAASAATVAEAQYFDDVAPARRDPSTPERFALELRIGPYTPHIPGGAFDDTFDDDGLLFAFEYDVFIWRIPYVGPFGIGAGFGWAGFSAKAMVPGGGTSDETTRLDMFPLPVLAQLRIDVLARELRIPFVFVGKLGADVIFWEASTGEQDDASGIAFGLRWGVQIALELDFLDRPSARMMDEEWGINHTTLFLELYGSGADSALAGAELEIGTDLAWTVGLGFTF